MKHNPITHNDFVKSILNSRRHVLSEMPSIPYAKFAEEGGCGVVGFAAGVPVRGIHIFEPSIQMHNRGNGKGGGIACACLDHEQVGVDQFTLDNDYILQIALLDPSVGVEVERQFVIPYFTIDHKTEVKPVAKWKDLGLSVQPPEIVRYFVRVENGVLKRFAEDNGLAHMPEREIEDEFICQNSTRLNQRFYSSFGDKRAFVLSHARNLLIFKIVGYAEQVVQYYGLENFRAQIWIAHQRYPTKGRVWHPAGAHPFIGMNEALVHNGDFANYYSVSEYLRQHNTVPQFLTDTEVSALLFDLWSRVLKYPLEYVIEAFAPTTELDFDHLSEEKQKIYKLIQSLHIHGSPDGPWFFIIAQSKPDENIYRLLGITDTAMLRPQVFAFQEGDVSIGLIASEKQAIDATLNSLSHEDSRFRPVADRYWNARGGSYTDGGAFSFTVIRNNGTSSVSCADKFGKAIPSPQGEYKIHLDREPQPPEGGQELMRQIKADIMMGNIKESFRSVVSMLSLWNFDQLRWFLGEIENMVVKEDDAKEGALALLTYLNDQRYNCGKMRRSSVLQLIRGSIGNILNSLPSIALKSTGRFTHIDWNSRDKIRPPLGSEEVLVICGSDFPPEGDDCDASLAVKAYHYGWRRFIFYDLKGQRFHGCGFGPQTEDVHIDIYGSSGDYLSSGVDGMEIYVHNNAQDQVGQIMKSGCLIVYGDVGQTLMYGSKGGEVYVMGNAAGRPLINAVGKPRVVINGTCLDFLAESFMAGNPHNGGGFVVLNGIEYDDCGKVLEQTTPYPGSNLFSLASGGAIFVRDPHNKIIAEQLNGGEFADFTKADWELILPYLQKNEELFGISVERDLLTVDGEYREPHRVYRKVSAVKLAVLAKIEVPE
ncbi:MAG: glutamate synthase [Thermodesulfobacteriota bacterium]|nr:glutamate synthase [Thermodesulfobacteriota bacterium]